MFIMNRRHINVKYIEIILQLIFDAYKAKVANNKFTKNALSKWNALCFSRENNENE